MPAGVETIGSVEGRGGANVVIVLGELLGEAGRTDCAADGGAEMVNASVDDATDFNCDVGGAGVDGAANWTVEDTMLLGFIPSAIAAIFRSSRDWLGSFTIASSQF